MAAANALYAAACAAFLSLILMYSADAPEVRPTHLKLLCDRDVVDKPRLHPVRQAARLGRRRAGHKRYAATLGSSHVVGKLYTEGLSRSRLNRNVLIMLLIIPRHELCTLRYRANTGA